MPNKEVYRITDERNLDAAPERKETPNITSSQGNVRVEVRQLDVLMNLVGELVLARNEILQIGSIQKDSALAGTLQRLNYITTELQEGIMKARMQPIDNVGNRFPRMVRDLAFQRGKKGSSGDGRHGGDRSADNRAIHVIVYTDDGLVSFQVDQVDEVIEIDEDTCEPPPVTLQGRPRELIRGVYRLENRLMQILDVERIVDLTN